MALTVIKGGMKVAVGVGAVYATTTQGVWSNGDQGEIAFEKVQKKVLPEANDYVESAPKVEDVNKTVTDYWNLGVEKTFSGLAAAPNTMGDYTGKAFNQLKQSLK